MYAFLQTGSLTGIEIGTHKVWKEDWIRGWAGPDLRVKLNELQSMDSRSEGSPKNEQKSHTIEVQYTIVELLSYHRADWMSAV
jgi:hypothetical protein